MIRLKGVPEKRGKEIEYRLKGRACLDECPFKQTTRDSSTYIVKTGSYFCVVECPHSGGEIKEKHQTILCLHPEASQ